jgi:hypothetical protein
MKPSVLGRLCPTCDAEARGGILELKGGMNMRALISAALAGAVAAMAAMPAQAAWKTYVNKELGFSFSAPGDIKAGVGTFRGEIAGPRQTILYRSMDDGVEYKVTVMSFIQAQAEGASILGEREYMFQNGRKVLADTFARAGAGKDAVYGRRIVVDLPDGKGRSTAVFYFTSGRLIALEATVLPGRGEPESSSPGRFVDSIAFAPSGVQPDAVALGTPKLE